MVFRTTNSKRSTAAEGLDLPGCLRRQDRAQVWHKSQSEVSLLASQVQNPSKIHMEEADHVIIYLKNTWTLAIEYNGREEHFIQWSRDSSDNTDEVLRVASDAAYEDDPDTRWSSEGYLIQLYRGPIDWRASKQKTVTTSTKEAELVSLANAAKDLA
ncbi:hypothetical protein VTO42DRAFT_4096 [Malbranchea cinnamomea]